LGIGDVADVSNPRRHVYLPAAGYFGIFRIQSGDSELRRHRFELGFLAEVESADLSANLSARIVDRMYVDVVRSRIVQDGFDEFGIVDDCPFDQRDIRTGGKRISVTAPVYVPGVFEKRCHNRSILPSLALVDVRLRDAFDILEYEIDHECPRFARHQVCATTRIGFDVSLRPRQDGDVCFPAIRWGHSSDPSSVCARTWPLASEPSALRPPHPLQALPLLFGVDTCVSLRTDVQSAHSVP